MVHPSTASRWVRLQEENGFVLWGREFPDLNSLTLHPLFLPLQLPAPGHLSSKVLVTSHLTPSGLVVPPAPSPAHAAVTHLPSDVALLGLILAIGWSVQQTQEVWVTTLWSTKLLHSFTYSEARALIVSLDDPWKLCCSSLWNMLRRLWGCQPYVMVTAEPFLLTDTTGVLQQLFEIEEIYLFL